MNLKLLVASAFLIFPSLKAVAYPQTISKGYTSCESCHITASGGSILNDYGRAMSSIFMSTFSYEDEAMEFPNKEFKGFDWGSDYRYLVLDRSGEDSIKLPMVFDIEAAAHFGNITLSSSIGYYGRDYNYESRESFARIKIFQGTSIRLGYFLPHLGINSPDHSLSYRRILGLGRGNETYNIELYNKYKAFKLFYTASSDNFKITESKKNFYALKNQKGSVAHRMRLSFSTKVLESGVNYLITDDYKVYGVFLKHSFLRNQYLFLEVDKSKNETASYARLGYFPIRGLDSFLEFDESKTDFFRSRNFYLGFNWMVRPRIELSIKVNLVSDGYNQYQLHLWN